MRNRRPCVTPARLATSTTCRCSCSMTSAPSARAIFRIVFASGTSPASIRVNMRYTKFARTSRSITPVEQMLEDQHPNDDLRRRARPAAAPTLRPPRLERLRDDLNHRVVLEKRVDFPQPVGPQLVPVRQEDLEQIALALSALNHARSFTEGSRAGSVVRE